MKPTMIFFRPAAVCFGVVGPGDDEARFFTLIDFVVVVVMIIAILMATPSLLSLGAPGTPSAGPGDRGPTCPNAGSTSAV